MDTNPNPANDELATQELAQAKAERTETVSKLTVTVDTAETSNSEE